MLKNGYTLIIQELANAHQEPELVPGSPDESAALRSKGMGWRLLMNQGEPGTNGKFARVREDANIMKYIALNVSTQVMGG